MKTSHIKLDSGLIVRRYTNREGLTVYRNEEDKWVAECEHGGTEEFDLKRDAMLAFGARFCPEHGTDEIPEAEPEPYIEPIRKTTLFGHCRCGCGENVARGRLYRPGHDARHAGAVARALIANDRDRAAEAARAAMSGALRFKVDKMRRAASK